MDTLCDMMKKYLPDKIVFPSLGNHEGVPVNAYVNYIHYVLIIVMSYTLL